MNDDREEKLAATDTATQPEFSAMQTLLVLLNQGRLAEGEAVATAMTENFPNHGFGWKVLGVMLKLQYKHGPALRAMHRAAELLPNDDEAQSNFGMALAEANELSAAECLLRGALALSPDKAQTNSNLGNILSRQGRLAEAERCHRHTLEIEPDNIVALCNLGSTLQDAGRHDEASACYRRALQVKPDFAQAQWNASMGKLLSGDFAEGWKQYEWRWQTDGFATTKRDLRQPRWQGHQSLDGKTILLHAEQGLGDTMQFCRYASLVAARRAKVILQVPRALKSLLTGLAGVAHLIADDEAVPLFDFHCPLLSLPLALNTTLATIPVDIPYLFAEHSAVAAWRKRLPATDEMRIGIAWSGNPLHRHDYKRSIALAEFAALFDVRSKFVCLQNEVRTSDAEILDRYPDIAYFGDVLHDFSDTAALIATLDLVITVDTAIAHLAAAMGKRVWILLPFQPDWRWLTLRPDSPWYPSARLFRQSALGDWKSVIVKVRQALQHKEF